MFWIVGQSNCIRVGLDTVVMLEAMDWRHDAGCGEVTGYNSNNDLCMNAVQRVSFSFYCCLDVNE